MKKLYNKKSTPSKDLRKFNEFVLELKNILDNLNVIEVLLFN